MYILKVQRFDCAELNLKKSARVWKKPSGESVKFNATVIYDGLR